MKNKSLILCSAVFLLTACGGGGGGSSSSSAPTPAPSGPTVIQNSTAGTTSAVVAVGM
jgi:hypothetical protein